MNPPKGIDPKVWEMAYGVNHSLWALCGNDPDDTRFWQDTKTIAEAISKAIEAEREDILRVIDQGLYLDGSYIETSGDEIYLISQAIRNRFNTTTERNEG